MESFSSNVLHDEPHVQGQSQEVGPKELDQKIQLTCTATELFVKKAI
jgi:hypothetical protein